MRLWACLNLPETICDSYLIYRVTGAGQIEMRCSESSSKDGQDMDSEGMRVAKMD